MSAASPARRAPLELDAVRGEIEETDRALVELLARRVRLARAAGAAKASADRPLLDPTREATVVRRAAALAREAGLPEEEVRRIFWHVVALSRQAQRE